MKSIGFWILSGICLILICWCNLNTHFINQNTEIIESFEKKSIIKKDTFIITPSIKVDTIYINLKDKL